LPHLLSMRRAALRAVATIGFWAAVSFSIGGEDRLIPTTENHRPDLTIGFIRR
jgi:hypothetical protein